MSAPVLERAQANLYTSQHPVWCERSADDCWMDGPPGYELHVQREREMPVMADDTGKHVLLVSLLRRDIDGVSGPPLVQMDIDGHPVELNLTQVRLLASELLHLAEIGELR